MRQNSITIYNIQRRLEQLLSDKESEFKCILLVNEHLLFKTQKCSKSCGVSVFRLCQKYQEVLLPKKTITMKILHMVLRNLDLYKAIPDFLHVFPQCSSKIHAESGRIHR